MGLIFGVPCQNVRLRDNLLVVAVIPALCEEMLFRGMIPKALLGTGFAYALYKGGFISLCNSCTFSIIGLLC